VIRHGRKDYNNELNQKNGCYTWTERVEERGKKTLNKWKFEPLPLQKKHLRSHPGKKAYINLKKLCDTLQKATTF